jgi:hypothetical protein
MFSHPLKPLSFLPYLLSLGNYPQLLSLLELLEPRPLISQLQALLLDSLSLSEDLALPDHEGLSDDPHLLLLLHYLLVLGRLTLHLL